MAETAAFSSPLPIPLGIYQGEPTGQAEPAAGYVSLLAFWGGGAQVGTGEAGGGGVTTQAYYMPTFRARRR